MVRVITDNPGGWSRSLPGHTVEFEASFAQSFYNGATVGVNAGATGTYAITISDAEHIFFPDMISITPQAYKEFAVIIYVNGSPYVAASGIGWLNIPLRQNPSIQLISGDILRIDTINLDADAHNFLVKVNGTKIVRPANFGHAPGAYFTFVCTYSSLKCHDNAHYVGRDINFAPTAVAVAAVEWEAFSIKPLDNGKVAIICSDGVHKLQAVNGGGGAVAFTTNPISTWESFTQVLISPGVYSFRCYDETHYLIAANGGGSTIAATSLGGVINEAFTIASYTGSYRGGGVPLTVAFTDASQNTPTSWDWDYGDGTPHGTTQNPVHTYLVAGSYHPKLKAINQYGYDTYAESAAIVVS